MPIALYSNTTPIADWVTKWREIITHLNTNLGTFRTGGFTANTVNSRHSITLGGQTIANTATIWTSATDGAGSGLDADTLDGYQASAFVRTTDTAINLRQSFTLGGQTIANTATIWTSATDGADSGLDADKVDGVHAAGLFRIGVAANTLNLRQSFVLGGQTIANTATIWTSATHGANSGLNADKVDGYHAAGLFRIGVAANTLNLRQSFTLGGQTIANTETIWTTGNLSARINALTANTGPNANTYYAFGYDELLQVTRKFRINDHGHTTAQITGLDTTLNAKAAKTQTFSVPGMFSSPQAQDYRIIVNIPFAGTITSVTTRSASGTATLTTKINALALGGTPNAVSSAEQEQTHAANNTFVAGDDIVLTFSSVSSATDVSFCIKGTTTLS